MFRRKNTVIYLLEPPFLKTDECVRNAGVQENDQLKRELAQSPTKAPVAVTEQPGPTHSSRTSDAQLPDAEIVKGSGDFVPSFFAGSRFDTVRVKPSEEKSARQSVESLFNQQGVNPKGTVRAKSSQSPRMSERLASIL